MNDQKVTPELRAVIHGSDGVGHYPVSVRVQRDALPDITRLLGLASRQRTRTLVADVTADQIRSLSQHSGVELIALSEPLYALG